MTVTVMYGKKDLVAIYKGNDLVATHDKFCKQNGDLQRHLDQLEKEGFTIVEAKGEFSKFSEIPETLNPVVSDSVEKPVRGRPKSAEPKVEDGVQESPPVE